MRWKTVPQTSGCNMKRSVADSPQGFLGNYSHGLTYRVFALGTTIHSLWKLHRFHVGLYQPSRPT